MIYTNVFPDSLAQLLSLYVFVAVLSLADLCRVRLMMEKSRGSWKFLALPRVFWMFLTCRNRPFLEKPYPKMPCHKNCSRWARGIAGHLGGPDIEAV